VRIITATNLDLKEEVVQKTFREDLYYRINTVEIVLPALRNRKEDKIPLAQFLLQKMIEKYRREPVVFEEKAVEKIEQHAWKGNIREMENKIERAIILCDNNCISVSDLDLDEIMTFEENQEEAQLCHIEKIAIEKILTKNNHNISKSAEELGLSRAALYRRIEKFNLQ
jgi:transcriptional regulator with PAS, ATPase and Fis domain